MSTWACPRTASEKQSCKKPGKYTTVNETGRAGRSPLTWRCSGQTLVKCRMKRMEDRENPTGLRGPHFLRFAQPLNDFHLKLGKVLIFRGAFMAELLKNHFMLRG